MTQLAVSLRSFALASSLLAVPAVASAPAPPSTPSAQHKAVTQLQPLIGTWKGQGSVAMGGQAMKVTADLKCQSAAAGVGVRCDLALLLPDGSKQEESDLFAWNAQDGLVHWFSITSDGDVHDHKGGFVGNTLHVAHSGPKDGQLFSEVIALTIESPKKINNKVVVTIGGQNVATIDMVFTK